MFPGEVWEGEKAAPGWVVLGAEKKTRRPAAR